MVRARFGGTVEGAISDGAGGGGAAEARSARAAARGFGCAKGGFAAQFAAGEGVIEVVGCGRGGGARGLRESAVDARASIPLVWIIGFVVG